MERASLRNKSECKKKIHIMYDYSKPRRYFAARKYGLTRRRAVCIRLPNASGSRTRNGGLRRKSDVLTDIDLNALQTNKEARTGGFISRYLSKNDAENETTATGSDANFAADLPHMNDEFGMLWEDVNSEGEDKSKDFFDDATMEYVRHNLFLLSSVDGVVTGGPPAALTFQSTVIGKRLKEIGKCDYLLRWDPENIIPDTWVTESELASSMQKTIPVSQLPREALQLPVMNAFGTAGILSRPGKRKRK